MVSDAMLKTKMIDATAPDAFSILHTISQNPGEQDENLKSRLMAFKDDTSLRRIATVALDMLKQTSATLEHANEQIAAQRTRIEQLEALATTDELTSVMNRRGFTEAFERELDRTTRGLTKGGLLLMIDIDNFKLINDTHGHPTGDAALRLVAETLKNAVRRMDVVSRLGGDEFVLLFSNADVMAAVDRAQQLAMRLNGLTLRWKGEKIAIRASIGMRAYATGDTVDGVLHGADSSMYAVKARRAAKREKERAHA